MAMQIVGILVFWWVFFESGTGRPRGLHVKLLMCVFYSCSVLSTTRSASGVASLGTLRAGRTDWTQEKSEVQVRGPMAQCDTRGRGRCSL